MQDEKQRKLLAKGEIFTDLPNPSFDVHLRVLAVHDARKNNSNQLGILREILFNERDVNHFTSPTPCCINLNDCSLGGRVGAAIESRVTIESFRQIRSEE